MDYIVSNGWTPCLEFAEANHAYISNESCARIVSDTPLLTPTLRAMRLPDHRAAVDAACRGWLGLALCA